MIAKVQTMKRALPPLMRFFSAIALTIACSWAAATTFIDLTLDQMIAKTDFSFFGTVSKIHIEDRGEPWTVVTFTIKVPLLNVDGPTVELSFLGGTLATGESLTVNLMPKFTEGEEILVLAYDDPYASPIVGFLQGLWRLSPSGFRNEEGLLLSLTTPGTLTLDGIGGQAEAILNKLQDLMSKDS